MTDWRAAGQLADAHRVRDLARGEYISPAQVYARTTAIAFLKAYCAGTILDLWGGGASAEALRAAGFDVLSVEDGRWLKKELGISTIRAQRSLVQSGIEGNYRTTWGHASDFTTDCTGAFFDFCGHFGGEATRALTRSRHMDAVVVKLMPERVAVGHGLTNGQWKKVYTALIADCLPDHNVRLFRKYQRERGQWAFVFGLVKKTVRPFGPRTREKLSSNSEMKRLTERLRYAGDPGYREHVKARSKEWENNRTEEERQRDRERRNERQRRWRAANPDRARSIGRCSEKNRIRPEGYKEKLRAYHAAYYQRRKAESSGVFGTPDEAV